MIDNFVDKNLKELFLSYSSNADYMKLTEFKQFIKEIMKLIED